MAFSLFLLCFLYYRTKVGSPGTACGLPFISYCINVARYPVLLFTFRA